MFRYYRNLLDLIAIHLILLTDVQQIYHDEILYLDTYMLKEQTGGHLQGQYGDRFNK